MIALPLSQPLWSKVFFVINIVIWVGMMAVATWRGEGILAGELGLSNQMLVDFGAKMNLLVSLGQYWRLVTANFLHVTLMHLVFNSYALWQLGPEVERIYGRRRFVIIYLLTGIFGATASYAWGGELSAGASGAIFGLVGTLVAFFLRHRDLFGQRGRAYLSNMMVIVVINLFIGISSTGIDNWGHIGGLVSGFLIGYGLVPIYALSATYEVGPMRLVDVGSTRRRALVIAGAVAVLVAAVAAITVWRVANLQNLYPS